MSVTVSREVLLESMRNALERGDKAEFDRIFDATQAALERKLGPALGSMNDPRRRT